jgi:nucleoside-diphosphate-sugar epimerase
MVSQGGTVRVLVSGTSTGLGAALRRGFDATAVARRTLDEDFPRLAGAGFDLIVHSAADARKELPATDLAAYRYSNLTLTERLLEIPHRLFVFISSQAVYPTDGRAWAEQDPLTITADVSLYGVFKLLAEDEVRRRATRSLILRCSSLVGRDGRANNIMRILRREPGRLFLGAACPYNLIAYEQIEAFIREALASGIDGTFNVGAVDWATLGEIARHLGAQVEFGEHLYTAPRADLTRIHNATRVFSLTTLDVAERVAAEWVALR